jgi:hypothetical protein
MTETVVHVVHAIDTEGPLHEPLAATFERLKSIFGVELPASAQTLGRLQRSEIDLQGREVAVARMLSDDLLRYNDDWSKIDAMLEDCMSERYRRRFPDSFGHCGMYIGFCMDHVGFADNPRRRDIGFHHVYDHYLDMIARMGTLQDGVHFHFHPMPFSRQAHHCGNHYFANGDTLFAVLSRRVIDRNWFPAAFRPGFDLIRPDSHWFLEQFIPFEYSNQSYETDSEQPDLAGGRFGDWRRAPVSWSPYHPDYDDYQRPGQCRRWIARTLNLGTRHRVMRQADVDLAFAEAATGKPAILTFADHDFRDVRPDVEAMHMMLQVAAARHPTVKFRYADAREACRRALALDAQPPFEFSIEWMDNRLGVVANRRIFGPQPYLALRTVNGQYGHDNFDIQEPFRAWSYVFDEHTVPVEALDQIGVAACDAAGGVSVAVIDARSRAVRRFAY